MVRNNGLHQSQPKSAAVLLIIALQAEKWIKDAIFKIFFKSWLSFLKSPGLKKNIFCIMLFGAVSNPAEFSTKDWIQSTCDWPRQWHKLNGARPFLDSRLTIASSIHCLPQAKVAQPEGGQNQVQRQPIGSSQHHNFHFLLSVSECHASIFGFHMTQNSDKNLSTLE